MSADPSQHLNQVIEVLQANKRLVVWSPGSPDPDFLAGAEVLRSLGQKASCAVHILGAKPLSLEVNRRLVKDFKIPFRVASKENVVPFEGVIIIDYSRTTLPEWGAQLPVLLHIDHHRVLSDAPTIAKKSIIDQEVGAVSTLFSEWLANSDDPEHSEVLKNCATPLYYAIQADTDFLVHASKRDQAMTDLLRPMTQSKWLNDHLQLRLSPEQVERVKWGIERSVKEQGLMLCGLGVLPSTERDLIAIAADLLIKRKGVDVAAVFALIRSKQHLILDVSLRAKSQRVQLLTMIKRITNEGGARPFKGAYQINLDYFLPMADSTELWHTIEEATRLQLFSALRFEIKGTVWTPVKSWMTRLSRLFYGDHDIE